jgi:hypothetical protein
MKKAGFLILFQFLLTISFAQNIYFNKRIDVTGSYEVCRGIITFKNGYLVAGGYGDEFDIPHIFLSKIDSIGNLKWTKDYITSGYAYYFGLSGSLFQTPDKYFAICGGRVPWPNGYGILIKVDSSGNKKWEKEYKLTDCSNTFNSGNLTKDRGYILTGYAFLTGPKYKYLLLKTDSSGNQQWYKTYTDNDPNRNYAGKSVIQTPDSGYCIGGGGGYWYDPGVDYRSIVEIIKTDSLGNEKWKKTYGNPNNCNGTTFMLCSSKDEKIVGSYSLAVSSLLLSNRQLYIAKFSLNGDELWNKKIGIPAPNKWTSWIQSLNDSSFIICGSNAVKDTNTKVIGWLFKINKNGDSIWYREYAVIQGIYEGNELWQVTPTTDGGFAGAGSLFPDESGGTQDIWVFKTDSMGCLVPNCHVGITEFNPNAGAQMLVFPNPFTNAFAINYNIPKENKKAVFMLYDVYGKLLYQIGLTTSLNQLQVIASSLKAGMYVAVLVVDGVVVASEKVIKE